MLSCESPNVPFTIFRTRFRKGEVDDVYVAICAHCLLYSSLTAPECIVYDNTCGLHTYCLKRDPQFFKETRFLADRFHWGNHTGKTENA